MDKISTQNIAFEPDYLDRKALAVEWTDALLSTKIGHHLVISISGDWGTGKTYLAQNWHKYLEEQGYFTCYIDAHKKDYAEDPLLVFVEELNSNINQYYKVNMGFWWKVRNKIPVLKNKVPKLLINSSTLIAGVEISSVISAIRIIIQVAQKFLSSKIKDKIKYLELYEKYISDFRKALAKFTCLFDKPVVIFIDELDRSNPKFVIKLIEQLKHIFEIPNLAFILTVNKKELSNTIKGTYGSEMDGYAYYKKFTTHDFTLDPIEQLNDKNLEIFIKETMNKYNDFTMSDEFINIAIEVVQTLKLSLRDIEQIIDHLFYIKDKVMQDYHREYLIICFLYRAMYVKDYSLFVYYKDHLNHLTDINIDKKGKYDDGKFHTTIFYRCLYNYLTPSYPPKIGNILFSICFNLDITTINKILEAKIVDEENNKIYCIDDLKYDYIDLYKPLFLYTNSPEKKYYSHYDLKQASNIIRKNLIQLSILGAVPKNNIVGNL